MIELVIWGEDDHQKRAEKLATTYNTNAQSIKTKPTKIKGLGTLVFWGHGTNTKFCGLTPDEFINCVTSWKKHNSDLGTVEMLTCNARHKQGTHTDSYTEQVVAKLSVKHADIRFRALPVATTKNSEVCEFSILKWHPVTATWAYVAATGTNDYLMMDAAWKLEDFMPPRGDNVGFPRALSALTAFTTRRIDDAFALKYKYDKKRVDDYNTEMRAVKEHSYIIAGTLGMLRWMLTDIR